MKLKEFVFETDFAYYLVFAIVGVYGLYQIHTGNITPCGEGIIDKWIIEKASFLEPLTTESVLNLKVLDKTVGMLVLMSLSLPYACSKRGCAQEWIMGRILIAKTNFKALLHSFSCLINQKLEESIHFFTKKDDNSISESKKV